MEGWQRWLGLGAGLGVIYALVPKAIEQQQAEPAPAPALERLSEAPAPSPEPPAEPDFSGLDLLRLDLQSDRVTSPLSHGRTAELTLDPQLQRETLSVMKRYALPEAGAVLMDTRTGHLLVYASQVREGEPFDVNVRAEAPAASLFLVAGAAGDFRDYIRVVNGGFLYEGLRHLVAEMGVSQIVYGSDMPFNWPDTIDIVVSSKHLNDDEKIAILGGNLVRMLKIPAA